MISCVYVSAVRKMVYMMKNSFEEFPSSVVIKTSLIGFIVDLGTSPLIKYHYIVFYCLLVLKQTMY